MSGQPCQSTYIYIYMSVIVLLFSPQVVTFLVLSIISACISVIVWSVASVSLSVEGQVSTEWQTMKDETKYHYNNVMWALYRLKSPATIFFVQKPVPFEKKVPYYCPLVRDIHRSLQWRHNERGGVTNHQPHDCLLNRLFRHRWKKASKPRVTGLCVGNSPMTGEFHAQMASNAENFSIWWRHHDGWWIPLTTEH